MREEKREGTCFLEDSRCLVDYEQEGGGGRLSHSLGYSLHRCRTLRRLLRVPTLRQHKEREREREREREKKRRKGKIFN